MMNLLSKKVDLLTLIAIVIMAISVSIFDLDDMSWEANMKSYIGIIIFIGLLIIRYLMNRK
jgi:uncharacterized membrane protein YgdD (TMEM256/DUF423 family)